MEFSPVDTWKIFLSFHGTELPDAGMTIDPVRTREQCRDSRSPTLTPQQGTTLGSKASQDIQVSSRPFDRREQHPRSIRTRGLRTQDSSASVPVSCSKRSSIETWKTTYYVPPSGRIRGPSGFSIHLLQSNLSDVTESGLAKTNCVRVHWGTLWIIFLRSRRRKGQRLLRSCWVESHDWYHTKIEDC